MDRNKNIQWYSAYNRPILALKTHIDWEWRDEKKKKFQASGNTKTKQNKAKQKATQKSQG